MALIVQKKHPNAAFVSSFLFIFKFKTSKKSSAPLPHCTLTLQPKTQTHHYLSASAINLGFSNSESSPPQDAM
ncbi:hypothetical protein VNO80_20174 [Phaseolus coccineus]|uniref:Uncharacterized protein n=1 Tax=Phaseolus coccineus TaxID=3886 RepID=A0AAN9R0H1_PHACN